MNKKGTRRKRSQFKYQCITLLSVFLWRPDNQSYHPIARAITELLSLHIWDFLQRWWPYNFPSCTHNQFICDSTSTKSKWYSLSLLGLGHPSSQDYIGQVCKSKFHHLLNLDNKTCLSHFFCTCPSIFFKHPWPSSVAVYFTHNDACNECPVQRWWRTPVPSPGKSETCSPRYLWCRPGRRFSETAGGRLASVMPMIQHMNRRTWNCIWHGQHPITRNYDHCQALLFMQE